MMKWWRTIINIGLHEGVAERERINIRLLNQLVLLSMGIHLLAGLFQLFFTGRISNGLLLWFPIPLYALTILCQHWRRYHLARILQALFGLGALAFYDYLYGPQLESAPAYYFILILVIVFIDSKWEQLFFLLLIGSVFLFNRWLERSLSFPDEAIPPFSGEIIYLAILFCMMAVLRMFKQGNLRYEDRLNALLGERKLQNELLEKQKAQITAQNRILERNNQELERFAYVASHDLKTPLRNVTSFLSLIRRKFGREPDQEMIEYLQFAEDGARQMYATVEALLEFSMIDKGIEERVAVDLNQVMQTIHFNLHDFIEARGATVEWDELPAIIAKPVHMVSLFQNLVENGIKYNESEAPRVEVRYRPEEEAYYFEFVDNGIGIAPEFHDRIFDIFKRLHTMQSYPGTGVGLALCRKILDEYSGQIWVESQEAEGARFCIRIPIESSITPPMYASYPPASARQ
ncbi:MAG TPA: ATP-binding protein [Saprospiraceae bacterium]|nr:ATP-binding protein [Saprospiraceae bacterium]